MSGLLLTSDQLRSILIPEDFRKKLKKLKDRVKKGHKGQKQTEAFINQMKQLQDVLQKSDDKLQYR